MFEYRPMFDLTGKAALVIGAGGGIGEAGTHGFSAFGATVFCADVNAAERTAARPPPTYASRHLCRRFVT